MNAEPERDRVGEGARDIGKTPHVLLVYALESSKTMNMRDTVSLRVQAISHEGAL